MSEYESDIGKLREVWDRFPLHGGAFWKHVTCAYQQVPERERTVIIAVEREQERWRKSVLFWVRLRRLSGLPKDETAPSQHAAFWARHKQRARPAGVGR